MRKILNLLHHFAWKATKSSTEHREEGTVSTEHREVSTGKRVERAQSTGK
jgi:hypothetical protein